MPRRKSKDKKAQPPATTDAEAVASHPPARATNIVANGSGSKRKRLTFSESEDDGDDFEEITLTVNEDYKKRFEHNKEREELHRLQEKFKKGDLDETDEDSSSSEDEDEDAELLTDDIDNRILQVVEAIRKNDPKIVKNANVRFFDDVNNATEDSSKEKKDKPVFLKDYHRMSLLNQLKDTEYTEENADSESKLPYSVQLARDRAALVKEIHAQGDDESDDNGSDEDGFALKKAAKPREVEAIELPDPSEDPEKFLDTFMVSKAWLPSTKTYRRPNKLSSRDTVGDIPELVDEDSDFDDKADEFETKYNFRFEAGEEAAEIVSYGREVVNAHSVRRDEETGRQRARRLEKEAKAKAKEQREADRNRLKQLKIKEVTDKLERIRSIAGLRADDNLDFTPDDLDEDFEEADWDKKMEKVFGNTFYDKKDKKPEWDDDIDINDIVPGYAEEEQQSTERLSRRQQKKQKTKDKALKKSEDNKLKAKIEEFVERDVLPFEDDLVTAPAQQFRYREVSPDSFNMEPTDILLADDAQLNQYIGLKKFAVYREPEKKDKDRKRFAKKKRLRQWRQEVFGSKAAPEWK
ncbi:KRI1-like family C-terminal-domain-containing protein [Limtongia smithiae]|uniref:KRI1-like family C-terminal-domain-containing protein n=1 Tax=Limtongia smithiae TaxID=1125753 RepID=UPI0034CFBA5A